MKNIYNWFRKLIRGEPHLKIIRDDGPYMHRWHLIPKNRWFNIYLHHFLGSDLDGALHNHPWPSISIIIFGKYLEHTESGSRIVKAFRPKFRGPNFYHRIELIDGPVWTLFMTGPVIQKWGFLCPKGHVDSDKAIIEKLDGVHSGVRCPD